MSGKVVESEHDLDGTTYWGVTNRIRSVNVIFVVAYTGPARGVFTNDMITVTGTVIDVRSVDGGQPVPVLLVSNIDPDDIVPGM
jgi:hypothetical protein